MLTVWLCVCRTVKLWDLEKFTMIGSMEGNTTPVRWVLSLQSATRCCSVTSDPCVCVCVCSGVYVSARTAAACSVGPQTLCGSLAGSPTAASTWCRWAGEKSPTWQSATNSWCVAPPTGEKTLLSSLSETNCARPVPVRSACLTSSPVCRPTWWIWRGWRRAAALWSRESSRTTSRSQSRRILKALRCAGTTRDPQPPAAHRGTTDVLLHICSVCRRQHLQSHRLLTLFLRL